MSMSDLQPLTVTRDEARDAATVVAMSAAQRQRAYRQRRKRAANRGHWAEARQCVNA